MRKWKASEIRKEAERIHMCPEGYQGPCWGPTKEDMHQAKLNLESWWDAENSKGP